MSESNAATTLRAALHALLRQIADDPQLSQALLQARPAPPPEPTTPARRGRPTA